MSGILIADRLKALRADIMSASFSLEDKNASLDSIDAIEAHMIQREKVIEATAGYIENQTGSCPNDLHDFEVAGTCERECGAKDSPADCWIEYFEKQVEATDERPETD